MKIKTLLLAVSIMISQLYFAQDSTSKRIKELHLGISSLSSLSVSLKYKRQIGKRIFFKIGAVNLSGYYNKATYSNGHPTISQGYSGGLSIGIEFRRNLSERFTFFHGPSVLYRKNHEFMKTLDPDPNSQQSSTSGGESYGINYSLGVLFKINKSFLLGAEIGPGVYQSNFGTRSIDGINEPKYSNGTSVYYNFNGNTNVVLVYRF